MALLLKDELNFSIKSSIACSLLTSYNSWFERGSAKVTREVVGKPYMVTDEFYATQVSTDCV